MIMVLNRSGSSLLSAILLMSCRSFPSMLLTDGCSQKSCSSVDFSEADINVAEEYLEKIRF